MKTIGKGLVALLSTSELVEQSANKYVFIASFTTTQNETLKVFEKLTGEKWKVEQVSSKPVQKEGLEKLGKGDYSVAGQLIQAAIFSDEGLADVSKRVWNEKLGLPKESLEDTLKAAL